MRFSPTEVPSRYGGMVQPPLSGLLPYYGTVDLGNPARTAERLGKFASCVAITLVVLLVCKAVGWKRLMDSELQQICTK